ncbi:MAG: ABC transporter permease [Lachnospiraceae bacterium]|nr:ABC transporter permease [Lachnospiraceae bacterium]
MNNFGVMYRYECKKLFNKKIVWISFIICVAVIIFSQVLQMVGGYYVDGKLIDTNYNLYKYNKRYDEALSGREINQSLIEETIDGYRKIPDTPDRHYISSDEYWKYARPYSSIFNFIRGTTDMTTSEIIYSWQPSETDLYAKRQIWLESSWEDSRLSEGEKDFWRKREAQIKAPYIFQANEGYSRILSSFQTVGFFELMFIAICLSGIFSDEHIRKTDQLILSSPLGKTKLYLAKITAGISFATVSTILVTVITSVIILCIYGAEGYNAIFQLIYRENSDPITCGQAVIVAYGNMVITVVIVSIFVMVLSEMLHSNIAALAVSTVLLILPMFFSVPAQYRMLSQIWDWYPWGYLAPWNVFGNYTISIFGQYLTPWQAVPMIYIVLCVIIAAIGKPIYERFQVSGR